MALKQKVQIVDRETGTEPLALFVQDIEALSASFKRLEGTRLSRKLLVALIKDDTGVTKEMINKVLDSLTELEKTYLKPKKGAKG